MFRRTKHWMIVGILTVSLLLPIGIGSVSPVSQAASTVTLNFLSPDFDEWKAFTTVANRIGKTEGIAVRAEEIPWGGIPDKILLDMKSGVKTWDYVFVYSNWVSQFGSAKLVVPVNDFLTNPTTNSLVNMKDFIPSVTGGLAYQGKLLGFPMLAAPMILAYRTDLFDNPEEQKAFQAKYGYPLRAPESYKQLLDMAEFFTRKKGEALAGQPLPEDSYGLIMGDKRSSLFHRFEQLMVAYGGDLIYNQKTMMPTVNSPQILAAAKTYAQLFKFMQPGNLAMSGGQADRVFADGRGAMTIEAFDNMLSMVPDPKFSKVMGKTKYVLLPTEVAARPHATVGDANGLGIYALSTHKDLAFKLAAQTLSTAGVKAIIGEYSGLVPMRSSVLNDPKIKSSQPELVAVLNLMVKAKPYTVFTPPLKEFPKAQDIVEAAISSAMSGQSSVDAAFNDAQAKLVDLFKQAGYIK